jgi:hypothetical protein
VTRLVAEGSCLPHIHTVDGSALFLLSRCCGYEAFLEMLGHLFFPFLAFRLLGCLFALLLPSQLPCSTDEMRVGNLPRGKGTVIGARVRSFQRLPFSHPCPQISFPWVGLSRICFRHRFRRRCRYHYQAGRLHLIRLAPRLDLL